MADLDMGKRSIKVSGPAKRGSSAVWKLQVWPQALGRLASTVKAGPASKNGAEDQVSTAPTQASGIKQSPYFRRFWDVAKLSSPRALPAAFYKSPIPAFNALWIPSSIAVCQHQPNKKPRAARPTGADGEHKAHAVGLRKEEKIVSSAMKASDCSQVTRGWLPG